jgi:hypothetical protein
MTTGRVPLLEVLQTPAVAGELTPADWSRVLGSARHSQLLPRLALLVGEAVGTLPDRVRDRLMAAHPVAERHERSIRWEVDRIRAALRGVDTRIVLLKGAAYVMAGLPAGIGRLATDVDILVPQGDIREVERALMAAGWEAVKLHPYDQRFYRQWSHELPPLRHSRRQTVVDVHHNILPVNGRVRVDARLLLEAAAPLQAPGVEPGLWTLGPEDMVLHNAAHLFQDGDLSGSVRDLVDADALIRDFAAREPEFWTRLPVRARELGLERALFYALRFARRLLGTPVPAGVDTALPRPPVLILAAMDRLVARSLLPVAGQYGTFGEESARLLLYVRSHWLRMPPTQLASHLARKALRRWQDEEEEEGKKQ